MKCNCISETTERLKARVLQPDVSDLRPKKGELNDISPAHLMLSFKKGEWVLMIPFDATWKMPNEKTKTTTVNVKASFCPFCGINLEEE